MIDGPSIGARVRQLRAERGWSQRKLAMKASTPERPISHSTIYLLEVGKTDSPGLEVLDAIAKAFGIPAADLLGQATYDPTLPPSAYGIQVSLLRISELNPDALKTVASILDTIYHDEQRKRREMEQARDRERERETEREEEREQTPEESK